MTTDSDVPTMMERYARALESSHLEMNLERRTQLDVVIAAGWAGDELGARLLRLRAEFDSVDRSALAHVDGEVAKAMMSGTLNALRPAMALLYRYALRRAARVDYRAQEKTIYMIAGHTLAWWLSPHCATCTGRGQVGVFGRPMAICKHCGGTGHRFPRLGKNDKAHDFGRDLHDRMQLKVEQVSRAMARFLK